MCLVWSSMFQKKYLSIVFSVFNNTFLRVDQIDKNLLIIYQYANLITKVMFSSQSKMHSMFSRTSSTIHITKNVFHMVK